MPEALPALPLAAWKDTCATLHLWTQIVGHVRMALAPPVNHWWHVPLYVTSRGLGTSPVPDGRGGAFEIDFDFVDHNLRVQTSDGATRWIALVPRSVADFHAEVLRVLAAAGVSVTIHGSPDEVPDPIPFAEDRVHASYDAEWAARFWRVLLWVDGVFKEFRGRFVGKCSPVHFFWGSFDLAVTRFSGRRAPARPGADPITREAYSHEVVSAGFWPGGGDVGAAFYSYTAPAPPGLERAPVRPAPAAWHAGLSEFVLPWEAVRTAPAPRTALLEFLESTYAAGATLAGWDRAALERPPSG
ncbi:MAG TPA: DUF5996 family protein [Candidatus Binatia bacterium]|nr:DUF5996 family protein [Candidatus Binatia bacterium]